MNKDLISFSDFTKLDIRIGEIKDALPIPDTDKLYRLSVDLGEEEERTIVSGIRTYFPDPSLLIGKKTAFVTNLEPRVLKGVASQGMLFAIGGNDRCVLVAPEEDVPNGAPFI